MISSISSDDFSNENFKFGTAKLVKINDIELWAKEFHMLGN